MLLPMSHIPKSVTLAAHMSLSYKTRYNSSRVTHYERVLKEQNNSSSRLCVPISTTQTELKEVRRNSTKEQQGIHIENSVLEKRESNLEITATRKCLIGNRLVKPEGADIVNKNGPGHPDCGYTETKKGNSKVLGYASAESKDREVPQQRTTDLSRQHGFVSENTDLNYLKTSQSVETDEFPVRLPGVDDKCEIFSQKDEINVNMDLTGRGTPYNYCRDAVCTKNGTGDNYHMTRDAVSTSTQVYGGVMTPSTRPIKTPEQKIKYDRTNVPELPGPSQSVFTYLPPESINNNDQPLDFSLKKRDSKDETEIKHSMSVMKIGSQAVNNKTDKYRTNEESMDTSFRKVDNYRINEESMDASVDEGIDLKSPSVSAELSTASLDSDCLSTTSIDSKISESILSNSSYGSHKQNSLPPKKRKLYYDHDQSGVSKDVKKNEVECGKEAVCHALPANFPSSISNSRDSSPSPSRAHYSGQPMYYLPGSQMPVKWEPGMPPPGIPMAIHPYQMNHGFGNLGSDPATSPWQGSMIPVYVPMLMPQPGCVPPNVHSLTKGLEALNTTQDSGQTQWPQMLMKHQISGEQSSQSLPILSLPTSMDMETDRSTTNSIPTNLADVHSNYGHHDRLQERHMEQTGNKLETKNSVCYQTNSRGSSHFLPETVEDLSTTTSPEATISRSPQQHSLCYHGNQNKPSRTSKSKGITTKPNSTNQRSTGHTSGKSASSSATLVSENHIKSPSTKKSQSQRHQVLKPDEDGDLPLHIAVVQNRLPVVNHLIKLMLGEGADLDSQNNLKQTALHLAVITKEEELVQVLLDAGASPNILDRKGQTCCHLAVHHKTPGCLKILLEKSQVNVDVNAKNYEGLTPLHRAVQTGHEECLVLLLDHRADINMVDGKSGKTPLYLAFECNQPQTADSLLQRGADVNIPTYAGSTVLQAANTRGQHLLNSLIGRNQLGAALSRELQQKLGTKSYRNRQKLNNLVSATKEENPKQGYPSNQPVTTLPRLDFNGGLPDGDSYHSSNDFGVCSSHRETDRSHDQMHIGAACTPLNSQSVDGLCSILKREPVEHSYTPSLCESGYDTGELVDTAIRDTSSSSGS